MKKMIFVWTLSLCCLELGFYLWSTTPTMDVKWTGLQYFQQCNGVLFTLLGIMGIPAGIGLWIEEMK